MSKHKKNKNSGITLIALVVTIIVLLILAGISIMMLSGNNGILNRAGEAKERTGIAQTEEQVKLATSAALADGLGTISYTNLNNELKAEFGEGKYDIDPKQDAESWTVTVNGQTYTISSIGKVGVAEESDVKIELKLTKREVIPTVGGNVKELIEGKVPIPKGFYHVKNTKVSTGLVISSEPEDDLNNTKGGNQFVWIPVDQNQELNLKITTDEKINRITVIGPEGTEKDITSGGKEQKIDMTINGTYTVNVTTENRKETARKKVKTLYAQDFEGIVQKQLEDKKKNPDYSNIEQLITEKVGEGKTEEELLEKLQEEGYKTLAEYMGKKYKYIVGYDEDFKIGYTIYYTSIYKDQDANQTNVNTYGGFYIARFEAGIESGERSTGKSSDTVDSIIESSGIPVSKINKSSYNCVTRDQANGLAERVYSEKTKLISGAAWDRTMNWLLEEGMTENDIYSDSKSWGNYNDSEVKASDGTTLKASGQSQLLKTGQTTYTQAKTNTKTINIYDLAGNVYEWSSETITAFSSFPCCRGGSYVGSGSYYPASSRLYSTTYSDSSVGFRVALYL